MDQSQQVMLIMATDKEYTWWQIVYAVNFVPKDGATHTVPTLPRDFSVKTANSFVPMHFVWASDMVIQGHDGRVTNDDISGTWEHEAYTGATE